MGEVVVRNKNERNLNKSDKGSSSRGNKWAGRFDGVRRNKIGLKIHKERYECVILERY